MRNLILPILLLACLSTWGQSKKTAKAKNLIQQGQLLESSMQSEEALVFYKKATKADPNYADAWYNYGQCLQKLGQEQSTQMLCFGKVVSLDSTSNSSLKALNKLSHLYYEKGVFDTSLTYFQAYLNHPRISERAKTKAQAQLPQKEYAANAYLHPLNIDPWPIHDWINDPNSLQYFPILTGDESQMIFTRRNKGSQNEDIYISHNLGDWQKPDKLPGTINSYEAEGTATISADGSLIICSYCGDQRESFGNCDLYYSKLEGKRWSALKNLGASINTSKYESQPSLSADGRKLYFVSDREGGLGELDIWMSSQNANGEWSQPVNLGAPINTSKNEGSPFFHPNGSSLFFASKGHMGMGGYDLFLSEHEEGKWQDPRNLGYPINDQNNQSSLFVNAKGNLGYFSKEEFEEGSISPNQSRIWAFNVPPELKLGHRSNYVKGKVFNSLSKKPIQAKLKLVNLETGETVNEVESDLLSGEYLVMLSEGSDYAFYAETPGFLFKSIAFDYREKRDFEPIELDLYLDPIVKGITVQLNNIYFQSGKAVLLNKSKVELNKLYQLMKTNPSLKIELGGHTDNVGSDASNLQLSQKRVDAVKNFLVKAGIPSSRIVGKGYGESKPISSNDSAEGRKENRRVEFTVL